MPFKASPKSDLVMNDVLELWRDVDTVEAYASGGSEVAAILSVPTPESQAEISKRVNELSARLGDIEDESIRAYCDKLLKSISVAIKIESPDEQVLACFVAIWYAILKEDQESESIVKLLDTAVELLQSEHKKWAGQTLKGEVRKACVDACASLDSILLILASKNPKLINSVLGVSATLATFRSLFSFPVTKPGDLDELFSFFEAHAGPPVENPLYPEIIARLFDYGVSPREIHQQSSQLLEGELILIEEVLSKLDPSFHVSESTSLGAAIGLLRERYRIDQPVVPLAQRIMTVLNKFVDKNIQDMGLHPNILPEATPEFLKPLVTSGAAIALNYLTPNPLLKILVTEDRNTSFLTLLNVLVHEATHAYSPLILSDEKDLPTLFKMKSWLCIPFYEATAFHREFELLEAIKGGQTGKFTTYDLQELLSLFDVPKFPLRDDVLAFEVETRLWRILRALRALCDVEVNTGQRTYVEFVNWASGRTGLSRETIHNECFTFLSYPGYTPSYSFCGALYGELQEAARTKGGVSHFEFNSRIQRAGLLPWTLLVEKLKSLA